MQKINSKNSQQKMIKSTTKMEQLIMERIKTDEIKMKPKWLFVLGSLSLIVGLVGAAVGATFLFNVTLFLLLKRGSGYGRLNMMLSSFPWWVPILAIGGVIIGIILLQKYDFSYKKNFKMVTAIFIISIILAAILLEISGLNDIWIRRGPMRQFYNQLEGHNYNIPRTPGHNRINFN